MAILKSPPKPPKNETLQIRIDEQIRAKLVKYAEFIDSSESYVVSEALKLVFRKDEVQSGGSEVLCRVAVPEQEPAGKDEERKNYTLQLRLLRVLQPVARAISLRSGR